MAQSTKEGGVMADNKQYFYDTKKYDARDYYSRSSERKGERQAYSKAYADQRQEESGYSDKKYLANSQKGMTKYDQGRMSDDAYSEAAKYERKKLTADGPKLGGKKKSKKKTKTRKAAARKKE
jgi:hypothetical protein